MQDNFQGKDKTYTDQEFRLLYRNYKRNKGKNVEAKSSTILSGIFAKIFEDVQELIDSWRDSSEDTISITKNHKLSILLTFEDAFELFHQKTLNTDREETRKCPNLVRILVPWIMDDTSKSEVQNMIMDSIRSKIKQTGLPPVKIYISDNSRAIPTEQPGVHIGIDYEPGDLLDLNKQRQAIGTIRTSRG